MEILKIPKMEKEEYDQIIRECHVSRIAFKGADFPYIAPFLYVFDGKYLYFLSTRYGRKIEYYRSNPSVSVEIEQYSPDLSTFRFVSLQGRLEEIEDPSDSVQVRRRFVDMMRSRRLSPTVMSALGHSPGDPPEKILGEERNLVWKLVGVKDIVALKNA
ncbi:MAG: Pyridoxamine 5'-phosphate oxidase [Methanoregulaceae archaeon PtaU1.Bin059]|nr:MAG: Pyridoxamine 5'-phosphate oxidase [Methanoregulaceae archaeon PtaB.Bin152]OPY41264.1 MAG: Pyridoxamine 5'-phosphate oxidase [Methanoregulaceae archaeon PtaU1.Bin059]